MVTGVCVATVQSGTADRMLEIGIGGGGGGGGGGGRGYDYHTSTAFQGIFE